MIPHQPFYFATVSKGLLKSYVQPHKAPHKDYASKTHPHHSPVRAEIYSVAYKGILARAMYMSQGYVNKGTFPKVV